MGEKITAEEAARRLGITVRTLWRWRDAGKIREAGRAGNAVLFWALDVDALRGVDVSANLTLADVYMRLADVQTWEDVAELKRDVADMLCTHADGEPRDVLRKSWRAACAVAATHPDEEARGRWARTARRYGLWLGETPEDTAALISRRASGSYEKALAELEATPQDPAWTVADMTAWGTADYHRQGARRAMSDNWG